MYGRGILYVTGLFVDFDSEQFTLTIAAGEIIGSYNLSISCDKVVEDDESFTITFLLANDNDHITIGQSTATVYITDSTGTQEYCCNKHCVIYYNKQLCWISTNHHTVWVWVKLMVQ